MVREWIRMTGETVLRLVEKEIDGNWSLSNWHGCNLRKCLVQPELREYDDWSGRRVQLWLILEEDPEERSGYKIVYSEEAAMFGLAIPGTAP
jgi:hypothetical protein